MLTSGLKQIFLETRRVTRRARGIWFRASTICIALITITAFAFFVTYLDILASAYGADETSKPNLPAANSESRPEARTEAKTDAKPDAKPGGGILLLARDAVTKRRQQALDSQRNALQGTEAEKSESIKLISDYIRLGSLDVEEAKRQDRQGSYQEIVRQSSDSSLGAAAALLAIEDMVAKEKFSAAEEVILANFERIKAVFPQRLARAVFNLQVQSGKLSEAIETYQKNRNAILMAETGSGEAAVEKKLVDSLAKALVGGDRDLAERGRALLLEIAREYPRNALSIQAFDAVKPHFQNPGDIENALWPTTREKREVATSIFRRLGNNSDYRGFALRVGGLEQSTSNEFLSKGGFTPEVRAALTADAEWFMDVREYEPASRILLALSAAKGGESQSGADKIGFLLARCANSLNQPLLAAEQYRKVFTDFPRSSLAGQAKRNFILSLHYAKKHDQVVAQIVQLSKSDPGLAKGMKWLKFWSYYLAWKRYPARPLDYGKVAAREALAVIKETRDEREAERYRYWLARIFERSEKRNEAELIYSQIIEGSDVSPYRVFAQWRKSQLNPPVVGAEVDSGMFGVAMRARPLTKGTGPRQKRAQEPGFIASSLELLPQSCPQMPPSLLNFVNVGLGDFARSILRTWNAASAKGESAFECAQVAVAAQDYYLASVLAKRSSANRWSQSKGPFAARLMQSYEAKRVEYPLAYEEVVEAVTEQLNIESSLVYGVMKAESHFKPLATSGVGARGLMQIMPQTGERISALIGYDEFHPDALYRPEINIALGAWYLGRLKSYYQGDLIRTIAAYNAGPIAVDRWTEQSRDLELDEFAESIPFAQTYGYVRKVLAYMDTYQLLEAGAGGEGLRFAFGPGLEEPIKTLEVF